MRPILFPALLALALVVTPAFSQTNVKGKVTDRLNDALNQHNQALEEAMGENPAKTPSPNTSNTPAPPAAKTSGWIERTLMDGTKVRMYFALPVTDQKQPKFPGIVVIQEWWGLNDDIQERTRELATHGFYAVAVDLYDGKVATEPKDAVELKKKLTDTGALLRLRTGVGLLIEESRLGMVDANRVGVIGWCMGGEKALKLAVADPRIKAVAMFYGTPVTDVEKLKTLKGPLLGIFGREDKSISNELIDTFEKSLDAAKVPHEMHRYEGVGHAFASKAAAKLGLYNEAKAAEAWKVTWDWLDKTLVKPAPAAPPK